MKTFPMTRDNGRDVLSVQFGAIVSIDGDAIWVKLEGIAGTTEFSREEFSDFDQPHIAVGRKIRYETGRQRIPTWMRYSQVNLEA